MPPLASPIKRVCYLSTDMTDEGADDDAAAPPLPIATSSALSALTNADADVTAGAGRPLHAVAEIFPQPNPLVLDRLLRAACVIYGCGSLYTSICPCLIVRGMGEAIASLPASVPRVLMLNGYPDRETSSAEGPPMDACAYVQAVVDSLNRVDAGRGLLQGGRLSHGVSDYVSVLLYPAACPAEEGEEGEDGEGGAGAGSREGGVPVDVAALRRMGVRAIAVPCERDGKGRALYNPQGVVDALARLLEAEKEEPRPRQAVGEHAGG